MKKRRIIGGILSLCIAASMWPSPLTAAAADSDTAIYVDYEAEYTPEDDIEITAQVERADTEQVLLWYRPCEEFVWKSMAMTGTAENGYSAVVARNSAWNTTLEFYVTAEYADGSSESSSVSLCNVDNGLDYQNLPCLLITEVVPDTADVDGQGKDKDAYEYIELFNNYAEDLDLSNYRIVHDDKENSGETETIGAELDGFVLKSGQAAVLWIQTPEMEAAGGYTVEQFNDYYGSALVEGKNLVRVKANGINNSGKQVLHVRPVIGTADISYGDIGTGSGTNDFVEGECVQYRTPNRASDNYTKSVKIGKPNIVEAAKSPSPGSVYTWQVPSVRTENSPFTNADDKTAPVVTLVGLPQNHKEGTDLELKASIKDESSIIDFQILLKKDTGTDYVSFKGKNPSSDGLYYVTIPGSELLNCASIELYATATDSTVSMNKGESAKSTIQIEHIQPEDVRLLPGDGSLVSGDVTVSAAVPTPPSTATIQVDGLPLETVGAMESGVYFTAKITGLSSYYKNGIAVGDDILGLAVKGDPDTRTVFVDKKYLEYQADGSAKLTVTIWAGSTLATIRPDSPENNDDIKAKNFYLTLADGTVLQPDNLDPNKNYNIGDAEGMQEWLDVVFTIPAEKFNAQAAVWDTTKFSDGEHTLTAEVDGKTVTSTVTVDNTAPVVELSPADGETVKGVFTIQAAVNGEDGAVALTAELDGEGITLPYTASTTALPMGDHELTVTAADAAGNVTEKSIVFHTPEENPVFSNLQAQVDGTDAMLAAVVTDPNGDHTDLSFKVGASYAPGDGSTAVFAGSGDYPVSGGEAADWADGLTTQVSYDAPYHRFEVETGELADGDTVELTWNGSAAGRTVQMYALNHADGTWTCLASGQTELRAEIPATGYVQNGKITVVVQNRPDGNGPSTDPAPMLNTEGTTVGEDGRFPMNGFPSTDAYDFSFAWITDTQYYAQNFPENFHGMNEWIVENSEQLKTKYLIHTGDIVNQYNKQFQWEEADAAMQILDDAGLPYGVLAGNHDVQYGREWYDQYYQYFGEDRYAGRDYYGGSYENNKGHYDLISENGQDFIILYMSWDVFEDEVDWMNQVLDQYSDRKAILCFHRFINKDGKLDQTGEYVLEKVVSKHSNIFAVLNGHYHGAAINVQRYDDDGDGTAERPVYLICTDYQADPQGGSQYIKFLYFDLENDYVFMNAYSPLLDDFNFYDDTDTYDGGDQDHDVYHLSVDFDGTPRTLTTDSFTLDVYTEQAVGQTEDVASGEKAQVTLEGLKPETEYFWYVQASSEETGIQRSILSRFVTGTAHDGESGNSDETDPVTPPATDETDPEPDTDMSPAGGNTDKPGGENDTASPETGDPARTLWIPCVLAAVSLTAAYLIYSRKRRAH